MARASLRMTRGPQPYVAAPLLLHYISIVLEAQEVCRLSDVACPLPLDLLGCSLLTAEGLC